MNKKWIILGVVAFGVLAAMAAGGEKPGAPKKDEKPADEPKVDPNNKPAPPAPAPTPPINKPAPKPADPKPLDPNKVDPIEPPKDAEAEACAWTLKNRPSPTYEDLQRGGDGLPLWLVKVAYRRMRPEGPVPPIAFGDLAIFARLTNCIAAGLASDPKQPKDAPPDQDPETEACAWALAVRPDAYADLKRGPGELEATWLSKVAYRRVRGVGPVPPIAVADLAVFGRLVQCVANGLAKPAGSQGIEAKAVTAEEKVIAAEVAKSQPQTFNAAPQPALQVRGDRGLANWLANIVYWRLYTVPESPWVKSGKPAAPWGPLPANSPWVAVWNRIRDYLLTLGVDNNKPAEKQQKIDEAAKELELFERQAADGALLFQPDSVDPALVPPPDNAKKPEQTQLTWLTNLAYWNAYRSPASEYIKSGNPPAPVKTPPGSKWAAIWMKLNAYIAARL